MKILSFGIVNAACRQRLLGLTCFSIQNRPIDIIVVEGSNHLKIVTPVYNFSKLKAMNSSIDLFSIIHIADTEYFHSLYDSLSRADFDVVLFELISDESVSKMLAGENGRRLFSYISMPVQVTQFANSLNLTTQTELYNKFVGRDKYFIADLDRNTIRLLEKNNSFNVWTSYLLSLIAGRTASENLLRKFFLPDKFFVNGLRLISWLAPCPELSCLLIDWSRMNPNAGGIPKVIFPILNLVLAGRFDLAKKVAFAQQLIAGLPDDGGWGGQAKSDIDVRIKYRNIECCRILSEFITEYENKNKPYKIAVLYGAYHIKDLSNRIRSLGFELINNVENPDSIANSSFKPENFVAWSIDFPKSVNLNNDDNIKGAILGVSLILAYLVIGALDWIVMLKLIVTCIEDSWKQVSSDNAGDVPFTIAFFILYVQRHFQVLKVFSSVSVEWDKGLFDDIKTK